MKRTIDHAHYHGYPRMGRVRTGSGHAASTYESDGPGARCLAQPHAAKRYQKHICHCRLRKQIVRPARARANDASYHKKHGDMWTDDGRAGNGERDRKSLLSCGPSITFNVKLKRVLRTPRIQLQGDRDENVTIKSCEMNVPSRAILFECQNLHRAVRRGCTLRTRQSFKTGRGHLLPIADKVVLARSEPSNPWRRALNHSLGDHDAAQMGCGSAHFSVEIAFGELFFSPSRADSVERRRSGNSPVDQAQNRRRVVSIIRVSEPERSRLAQ